MTDDEEFNIVDQIDERVFSSAQGSKYAVKKMRLGWINVTFKLFIYSIMNTFTKSNYIIMIRH